MSDSIYKHIGERASVYLYDREGTMIGFVEGRIADVAENIVVGQDAAGNTVHKDLYFLVDLEGDTTLTTHKNEGWYAVQDCIIESNDTPTNISFN